MSKRSSIQRAVSTQLKMSMSSATRSKPRRRQPTGSLSHLETLLSLPGHAAASQAKWNRQVSEFVSFPSCNSDLPIESGFPPHDYPLLTSSLEDFITSISNPPFSVVHADSVIRCVPGEDLTNGFFVSCFIRTPIDTHNSQKRKARDESTEEVTAETTSIRRKPKKRKAKKPKVPAEETTIA